MFRPETLKKTGKSLAAVGFAASLLIAQRENRRLRSQLFWNQWSHNNLLRRLDEAEKMATTDPLTSLYNRRVADEKFEKLVARKNSPRSTYRSGEPLTNHHSLILIDLDNFSDVNNSGGGHNEGDRVLAEVAGIISGRARENDLAVRLGGDEMMLILEHTDELTALKPAEDIRALVEGSGSGVTISVGVAQLDLSISLKENIGIADQALYAAKHAGRNQVIAASTLSDLPGAA